MTSPRTSYLTADCYLTPPETHDGARVSVKYSTTNGSRWRLLKYYTVPSNSWTAVGTPENSSAGLW